MARVPIPDSGGRHRSLGTFTTKRQAEDALATERAAIVGGTFVDPSRGRVTLAEYAGRYIATNGYRARTMALNTRLLEVWITPRHFVAIGKQRHPVELGARPLSSITPDDVRMWSTAVLEESRRRALARHTRAATSPARVNAGIREWAVENGHAVAVTGRIPAGLRKAWEDDGGLDSLTVEPAPTAGATEAAQAYRLLHAVLERAVEDQLIPANAARIKRAGLVDYPEQEPATIAEVRAIANAMPARYAAAVWVAALTSLRSGEQFALRRRDYNPRLRTLRIERAVELEAGAADFGEVKAAASLRTVVVPGFVADVIEAHMATYTAKGPNALIFTTSEGNIVYPDRIGKPYRRAREAAGRSDLRWHDLRHTGQSLAAMSGAGIRELQARAGHSSASAAIRYVHRFAGGDQRIADSLDALARLDDEHGKQ